VIYQLSYHSTLQTIYYFIKHLFYFTTKGINPFKIYR